MTRPAPTAGERSLGVLLVSLEASLEADGERTRAAVEALAQAVEELAEEVRDLAARTNPSDIPLRIGRAAQQTTKRSSRTEST